MNRPSLVFAIGSALLVITAVATAFFVLPAPWEARKRKLDDIRVRDLNTLTAAIAGMRVIMRVACPRSWAICRIPIRSRTQR